MPGSSHVRPVHTAVPATRVVRTGTAYPPLTGVMKTSEWYAQRYVATHRRRPWWHLLFRQA